MREKGLHSAICYFEYEHALLQSLHIGGGTTKVLRTRNAFVTDAGLFRMTGAGGVIMPWKQSFWGIRDHRF